MDKMFIPLPLWILAIVVLMGGLLGIWRARGRSAKRKWFAGALLLFAIAAVGYMVMLAGG